MLRSFLGEFMGTFILVLFGTGAVAGAVLFGAFVSLYEVAMIWGLGVALGIFVSRNLSDAHLNPAVTAAFLCAKRIKAQQLPSYLLGQFAGAFVAGLSIYLIFGDSIAFFESTQAWERGAPESRLTASMFGEFYPNPGFADKIQLSLFGAIATEVFGTFLLVISIFFIIEKADQQDNVVPLMIGGVVSLVITLIAPFTQACLNPARDFSPRMVSWIFGWGEAAFPDAVGGWFWVYILGPVLGGVMAFLLYSLISKRTIA